MASNNTSIDSPFTLAVCAEMQYLDLPLFERIQKIQNKGFQVEIWDWTKEEKDLEALATAGANIGSMTGYIRGNLTEDEGIAEFLKTAEESIRAAKIISCPRLNFHGTGLGPEGLPVEPVSKVTGKMWAKAALTIEKLAEMAQDADVTFSLENLNLAVDHPGTPFASPHDTLALVSAVDSPNVKMNLDLYHAQIGWGNLIETCRTCLPYICEIQVADVPGRCEPGTGEINYPNIAKALKEMGYRGVIAMEAWAKSDSDEALNAFARAFGKEATDE